jgi:hypothetical protein
MHLYERSWADNFRLKFEIDELAARAWANACRAIRTADAPAQQIDGGASWEPPQACDTLALAYKRRALPPLKGDGLYLEIFNMPPPR